MYLRLCVKKYQSNRTISCNTHFSKTVSVTFKTAHCIGLIIDLRLFTMENCKRKKFTLKKFSHLIDFFLGFTNAQETRG